MQALLDRMRAPEDGRVARLSGVAGEVRAALGLLRRRYHAALAARDGRSVVLEWLCDNFYILEREGHSLLRELRRARPAPALDGQPAVWLLCRALVEQERARVTTEALDAALEEVQTARALSSREFELLLPMLRGALILAASRATDPADYQEDLIAGAVTSLRFLGVLRLDELVEKHSAVEQTLLRDPAGVYPKMEEKSRALYRAEVAALARRMHKSEQETAEALLALAETGAPSDHIGYYLLKSPPGGRRPRRGKLWMALTWLCPLALTLLTGALSGWWLVAALLFLPFWEICRPVLDHIFLRVTPAEYMPRLDLTDGIPPEGRTLVVISALLTSTDAVEDFARRLEQFYHSNRTENLAFGLLADFKEKDTPDAPEDKSIRRAAKKAVRALNEKYGGGFYLFLRDRVWCKTQGRYAGWERKRGAMLELAHFIRGGETSIKTYEGDLRFLRKTAFILTLDADTQLLMNTARELVSVMLHPLGRARLEGGRVVAGHAILAPRMGVDLASYGKTAFSRIMAGKGGISVYDAAVGDIYQDLFDEGIFAGKGLIDLDAFTAVMEGAFPEERILSHDILEGNLLRAGYVSDVELCDGYPSNLPAYLSRLHRWARGDIQNAKYIFDRRQSAVSRYKLFDNVRRVVTPPVSLLLIALSLLLPLGQAALLAGVAAVSFFAGDLFAGLRELVTGGPKMLMSKYHNKVMSNVSAAFARCFVTLAIAAQNALTLADAAWRAVWRQLTGKKLLEWATAAEGERRRVSSANALFRAFWPSIVYAGLMLALPSRNFLALPLAALWLLLPILAFLWGRPARRAEPKLSEDMREELLSYASAMWHFFEDTAGEDDNFLPPDNLEESPVQRVAHRTSPTNIGLLLLSTLAARDLKLIDTEQMTERLLHTVTSVEKLKKWNGNLYNWYDTRTLKPLSPAYISSVDSGNFVCCLVALREGIREYYSEDARLWTLGDRLEALIGQTQISAFYNKRRHLMHIGFDMVTGELSTSYYDLLMSEALLTVYFAIATRQTDKRLFAALGRMLAREKGYRGPVSWTGTMFEYFMPPLLLPVYDGSLLSEALKFALFCQKRRAARAGVPWGISESAFYGFDSQLNYQYKAHGVQKLALHRGMDAELVVSPYSTFLALPFDRLGAIKNLHRLRELGMTGRYGFYEAADFTARRTGGGVAVVKSYMSHHVGMSLVAVANTLLGDLFPRRFLKNSSMNSAVELLMEKIPSGAVVFDDVRTASPPEKPGRAAMERAEYDEITPLSPRAHVLTNGDYTLTLSDCGAAHSAWREADVTRRTDDLLRDPAGFYAFVRHGGTLLSATHAPFYKDGYNHQAEFSAEEASFFAHKPSLDVCLRACVHGKVSGEARQVIVKNLTGRRQQATVLVYFEPVLQKDADFSAHRAFSKLFVSSARPSSSCVTFSRRPRGEEEPMALAVCWDAEEAVEMETRKEQVLSRPQGVHSLPGAFDRNFSGGVGAVLDPCFAFKCRVTLPPRSQRAVTFYLAVGSFAAEAQSRAVEMRSRGYAAALASAKQAAKNLANLSMTDEMENTVASIMLPYLTYPKQPVKESVEALGKNRAGVAALWSVGISGDLPVVLAELPTAEERAKIRSFLRIHRALQLRGVRFDLVFSFREGGEYTRPIARAIREVAQEEGMDYLLGVKGGVYCVDVSLHAEMDTLLRAVAAYVAPPMMLRITPPGKKYTPAERLPAAPTACTLPEDALTIPGRAALEGGRVLIPHTEPEPRMPWCHVLANAAFGTLVSDRSLGFTWALSSRENKLTPWSNDPLLDNQGEMLLASIGGKIYNLLANAAAEFTPGAAVYRSEAGGIAFRIRVEVCGRYPAKRVAVTAETQTPQEIHLAYYAEPVLGVTRRAARHVWFETQDGALLAKNNWNTEYPGWMLLASDREDAVPAVSRGAFLAGHWRQEGLACSVDPCMALSVELTAGAPSPAGVTFFLGFSRSRAGALRLVSHLRARREPYAIPGFEAGALTVETPDRRLNLMINTWLPWQTLACRVRARAAFYQCGGAWGFRDQLQDVCALLLHSPRVARQHIVRAASRQFAEGDVLHWWHEVPGQPPRGVRTRCSDDLLWLPYAAARYVEVTGDESLLDAEAFYLEGDALGDGEGEKYMTTRRSALREPVFRHCLRAIACANKLGEHGLPLIGTCDWNDGFSAVGDRGRGESVWLAMFYALVLDAFAPLCDKREPGEAEKLRQRAAALREAVDRVAWDGEWYLRAFTDEGQPMGGHEAEEGRIDCLPQSFAVLCGMPDGTRVAAALDAAQRELVDDSLGIIRLFTPAYQHAAINPGYIRSYLPGIRENGGQYTHGAIWLAVAMARAGRTEEAWRLARMLDPLHHAMTAEDAARYAIEPYYIAADIYSNPSCAGRGGWSLYTGAAGWYFRLLTEELLGLRCRGDRLLLAPLLPQDWQEVTARLRRAGGEVRLAIRRTGRAALTVDGQPAEWVPLDGRDHEVVCEVV